MKHLVLVPSAADLTHGSGGASAAGAEDTAVHILLCCYKVMVSPSAERFSQLCPVETGRLGEMLERRAEKRGHDCEALPIFKPVFV